METLIIAGAVSHLYLNVSRCSSLCFKIFRFSQGFIINFRDNLEYPHLNKNVIQPQLVGKFKVKYIFNTAPPGVRVNPF
jgi:hypothetical protein